MDWKTYAATQKRINTYYAQKVKEYRNKRDLYLQRAESSNREAQRLFDKKRYIENGPYTPRQRNQIREYATRGAYEQNLARRQATIARNFDNKAAKYAKILYEREERFPFHVPVPPWSQDIIPPSRWPPTKEDLYINFHKKVY